MKKLFFTFIALLIVFFSAWGIKLRMPINRPNNVQGEQQVAWYETRYTAPTAEEEWTLDPEIPVNYLPVAGEDEVYMLLDTAIEHSRKTVLGYGRILKILMQNIMKRWMDWIIYTK